MVSQEGTTAFGQVLPVLATADRPFERLLWSDSGGPSHSPAAETLSFMQVTTLLLPCAPVRQA